MGFEDFLPKAAVPDLSIAERNAVHLLVVDSDVAMRNSMRQALTSLGYQSISEAPNHALALQKLAERPVTHVIFEAKRTNMPPNDFLTAVLSCDERIICLPSSYEPTVDDIFSLLIAGARGYLVKPFTPETLDDSIIMATKGEAISGAILYAKDRNEALVSLMMTALDKLAITLKQAKNFETAKRELPRRILNFRRAVEISKTFAQGGKPVLVQALLDFCIDRSNGPATRLGRLRKRLGERKGGPGKEEAGEPMLKQKSDGAGH
ncbi:MAG: response regulator [Deltaproteobacteria bacterium]|nr:response regulator [Deltaproteobacteria bacterium]